MNSNAKVYTIELLTKKDETETLDFLRNHFYRDEPLCQFLGLESTSENPNIELDEFSLDGFDNGWGFKAVNKKGEIVGLSLNMIIERDVKEDFNVSADNKFIYIKKLLDHMMDQVQTDVWVNNPDFKRGIVMTILSVDKNYGGQGIGTELARKLRRQAKDQKLDFILVECTSHFSSLVAKKMGFKLVYSIAYKDYKPNGEVILNPKSPHNAATVWVDKL